MEKMSIIENGIVGLFSGSFTKLGGATPKCPECEAPLRYEMPMRMQ